MNYWSRRMSQGAPPPPQLPIPPMPGTAPRRESTPPVTLPEPKEAAFEARCPECGSHNYGGAVGSTITRCFDCSYGSPYRNPSQGMSVGQVSDSPTRPATQVASSGYNPQQIIGRVN